MKRFGAARKSLKRHPSVTVICVRELSSEWTQQVTTEIRSSQAVLREAFECSTEKHYLLLVKLLCRTSYIGQFKIWEHGSSSLQIAVYIVYVVKKCGCNLGFLGFFVHILQAVQNM